MVVSCGVAHATKPCALLYQAKLDIMNARRFANAETVLVVDDASFGRIKELLQKMLDPADPVLVEVDYASYGLLKTKAHRMFHYVGI